MFGKLLTNKLKQAFPRRAEGATPFPGALLQGKLSTSAQPAARYASAAFLCTLWSTFTAGLVRPKS